MNKELIKQFNKEFNHWLNGGSLLHKNILNTYAWLDSDIDRIWRNGASFPSSHYQPVIIINDDYVELRKALTEGKTIQINCMKDDAKPYWQDDDEVMETHEFEFDVNSYRIKPNKPEFKVGDWVTRKSFGCKIFESFGDAPSENCNMIRSIDKNGNYEISAHVGGMYTTYKAEHLKLWKPKMGEWCWVYNAKGVIPQLKQYTGEPNIYYAGINNADDTITWKFCEPFFGVLPTAIKG